MIVVTGATGQLGSEITRRLRARLGAARVGASARDVDSADGLARLGVRVRRGDFEDPASLARAFEGASAVVVVSSNARARGGDAVAQHDNAIRAAREAGARRVIYTSHMAASARSAFPPMLDHAATEARLAESGLAWTSLRNGFYASSASMLMGDALRTGVLEAPEDGKVAWTAHADLAEAAAVIAADGGFEGPTPPLTGSEALDLTDLAAIASEVTGRAIRRVVIGDDVLRARLEARGLPPHLVAISLGLFAASRAGELSAIDDTLTRLIGRPPTSMRDVLAAAASQGKGAR